jgi:hypothetical protein
MLENEEIMLDNEEEDFPERDEDEEEIVEKPICISRNFRN